MIYNAFKSLNSMSNRIFIAYVIFVLCTLIGCKTVNTSVSTVPYEPISNMYNIKMVDKFGDNYNKCQYEFENYVKTYLNRNIITDNALNTNGTIEIVGKLDYYYFHWWSGTFYLAPLTLLGIPSYAPSIDGTLQFVLKDSNGYIRKTYNYTLNDKVVSGVYYGMSSRRLALEKAKSVMKLFKKDFERDYASNIAMLAKPYNEDTYANKTATLVLYKPEGKRRGNTLAYDLYVNSKKITSFTGNSKLVITVPAGNVKMSANTDGWWAKDFYIAPNEAVSIAAVGYSDYVFIHDVMTSKDKNTYAQYIEKRVDASFAKVEKPKKDVKVEEKQQQNPQQIQSPQIAQHTSKQVPQSTIDMSIPATSTLSDYLYALIIANENYEYLDNVNYASHDGQIFKEYCIKTLGIPERQIFYYNNATVGKLVDGIDKLRYVLDNFEGSKAIVYYCGHGIPDEKTGQAYLIPVDGKGTNMTTCYSLNTLYKTLAATKAESITYFMDACFTGANKEGSMLVAARGVALKPKKEVLEGKSIVFSASSGDETAMTLEEQGHGLFTYYLLKKLQETEGNVTYGELSDYIKRNVQKDAFLINEKPQTPVVATSPAVVNTWRGMKLK